MNNKPGAIELAAAANVVSEDLKMAAYKANVAKLPKQDRRAFAAAAPRIQWVMAAVGEWFDWYADPARSLGLPRENVLHRAGLLIPRAPIGAAAPSVEPPSLVLAVEAAVAELKDSRSRVLIANERFGARGIERVARHLGMSVESTKSYLKQARDHVASYCSGRGFKVPKD